MTLTASLHEGYAAGFEALRAAAPVPSWLAELRAQGWERFNALGFPTARRGNEKWKYTNVRPVAAARLEVPLALDPAQEPALEALKSDAPWDDSWVNLVFVDGVYSPALSSPRSLGDETGAASIGSALNAGDGPLHNHLGQLASVEDDAFVALNTAFLRDGALVQAPPGRDCPAVLNLVYVSTESARPKAAFPRTLVVAGANSRLTVAESYVGPSAGGNLTNAVTEIVLEEGAHVDHYSLLKESPGGYHVGTTRVVQAADSFFASTDCSFGMALGRHDLQVVLDGPGSSCDLKGLYLTSGSQHMDNFINIDHACPHTTSDLFYKGVLDGRSKAIFGGTVLVRKDSQKAKARQTDRNLLLSRTAEVDSKPSLLIYADDVQCGHGATAGHIDPEALFYLRSRGLGLDTARRFLVEAFAREIVDAVKVETLRDFLNQAFIQALPTSTTNQEAAL